MPFWMFINLNKPGRFIYLFIHTLQKSEGTRGNIEKKMNDIENERKRKERKEKENKAKKKVVTQVVKKVVTNKILESA